MGTFIIVMIVLAIVGGILSVIADGNAQKSQTAALSTITGFKPVVSYGGGLYKAGVAIDPATNQFAIIHPGQQPKVFRFAQLVAVEVGRNGTSVTKTNRGSQVAGAAVGAVLLGPLGLLLGGVTGSKRNIEKVKCLSLKVYTNDLVKPIHEIIFLSDVNGFKPDSLVVTQASAQLDEWYGRFRTILEMRGGST